MPTAIFFAGSSGDASLVVRVAEDTNEVESKFNASGGSPFPLTRIGRNKGEPVYVNPANVAYWHEVPERGGSASFA